MRFFLAFLVFLSSCSFAETYPAPISSDTVEEPTNMNRFWKDRYRMRELAKRTVHIGFVCGLNQQIGTIGTGVVLKRTNRRSFVATAEHIVYWFDENPQCEMIARDYNGFSGFATVYKRNSKYDVAVVEVNEPIGSPAPLYEKTYLGQPITCVGFPVIPYHPNTDEMSITRGYVSTLNVEKYFIRVSADLYYGNSGGACFSNSGKVVGIVSYFIKGGISHGTWDPPQAGQFFISDVKNLKKMLD